MKHKKPLAVRIFIRICVVFMAISLIGVYVVYMFTPAQEAGEDNVSENTGDIQEVVLDEENPAGNTQISDEVITDIDSENPEITQAPIVVTEDGEIDEMDQTFEVQLENGETEIVRQGDFGDAIQINQ